MVTALFEGRLCGRGAFKGLASECWEALCMGREHLRNGTGIGRQ